MVLKEGIPLCLTIMNSMGDKHLVLDSAHLTLAVY